MKPLIYTSTIILIVASFITGMYFGHRKPTVRNQPLRLEEILSIKELHLVKHVYQDLFFVHKKNNPSKAVRAIVHVPVEITAYLDLKEIQVIYIHDSIKQVVLPHAHLNVPRYRMDQMAIQQTHAFQIHFGKDLYPEVGGYVSDILKQRMDTVRALAISNRILIQAEIEGKAYIENLLKAAGRADVIVLFTDVETDHHYTSYELPVTSNRQLATGNPEL